MRYMKNVSKLVVVLLLTLCIVGCAPSVSDTAASPFSNQTEPPYTLSPIIKPTLVPTLDPTAPTPTPTNSHEDDYYIYTLDQGDGKYPYAWTESCPISGEKEYTALDRSEVSALQTRLTDLGFYCGGTTGRFNALTLTAVNEFQAAVGLQQSSKIMTQETINTLFSSDGIEAMQITEYEITEGALAGITVILDAGHGGSDTGTARGSLVERTFVIETTYRVKQMLEKAGARVIMTRSNDTLVSLAYRSAITNDVMLEDLCKQAEEELSALEKKKNELISLTKLSVSEIKQKIDTLIKQKTDMLEPIEEAYLYAEQMLELYGKNSDEYVDAYKKLTDVKQQAASLNEEYEFIMQAYYSVQLGVSAEIFESSYNSKLEELNEYRDKLLYYRQQLKITLDDPYTADTGLWVKQYDNNGLKVINSTLKEILELTGEKCADKYIFVSVHVNGVDNADHVNGTEIYVHNINSTNNTYGINRYYYSNYNTVKRAEFASCVKKALDEVMPLENNKESVIKDSDLWVLREINIPCILLETGYVTNSYDRIRMQLPQTRNAFAYALYCGISEYCLN